MTGIHGFDGALGILLLGLDTQASVPLCEYFEEKYLLGEQVAMISQRTVLEGLVDRRAAHAGEGLKAASDG